MTRGYCKIVGTLLAAATMTAFAFAQPAADAYRDVLQYKFDQPRTALLAIEAEIRAAKPGELRAIEARLLAILQSPEATSDAKDWVCRQLRLAGSEQALPALAPLLADRQLATVARWALQSIPGAKVDAALRDAVGKLQGDLKAGAILTLGARRDPRAVPLLAPLAADPDAVIAEAALYALGNIGGADAMRAIQDARPAEGLKRYRFHAILRCAESLAADGQAAQAASVDQAVYQQSDDVAIKTAALRGIVVTDKAAAAPLLTAALKGDNVKLRAAAARFACELGGGDVLGRVLADLTTMPADAQAVLLGLVNDKAALPAVLSAAKGSDPVCRQAAIGALGRLGDSSCLGLLLGVAAEQGDVQAAARKSLQELRGKEVDSTLILAAEQGEPAVKPEAIRALSARSAVAAVPVLLKLAASAEPAAQSEAVDALAVLADAKALPDIVNLLVAAKVDAQRAALENALVVICRRQDDKDAVVGTVFAGLAGSSGNVRAALVRVLARIPSAQSLEALRAGVGDADAAVKDAAIRGLVEWPEPSAMADLLALARGAEKPAYKVLALRGLIRLASLPSNRPAGETTKYLADAMTLATRPEEKRLVLAALADIPHPAALDLAVGSLTDKAVEVEAAAAVVKIAKAVRGTNSDAAKAAVKKVLDVCQSPAARQVAESSLAVLDTGANIAPQGKATSPDDLEKDGAASGDQAAIDDNPATYWDEVDGKPLYRLVVSFKQPEKIGSISVMGYEHHQFAPRDFEILCDGKPVKKIQNAQYDDNLLIISLDEVAATTVELKITGCYGGSPAIRELGIYGPLVRK
jgi:HEAT repeat protein